MPQYPLLRRCLLGASALLFLLGLLANAASPPTPLASAATPDATTTSSTSSTTTTTTVAPPPPTAAPTTVTTAPPPPPAPRRVFDTEFRPFANAMGVTLHYPSARVEKIGFHQSNRLGARTMDPLPTIDEWIDMSDRERNTPPRGAADVLADPDGEVRAPVTGRVIRGGTYTLYCKYTDSFLVVEPDAHPGWEVKLLHITGLVAKAGDRVEAGVTPVAVRPTRLPFESQVEDYSAAPVWPHVHIEVVDPSIKNPPGVGGSGCS